MKKIFTYIGNNIYKILFLVLGILFIINFYQLNKNLESMSNNITVTTHKGVERF
jgi:uncharacterized protein YoxC